MHVDDKHHYASLASLAAMMVTITTHRLHVKPGLAGHLKCVRKDIEKMNVDDKHRYACLASLAARMITIATHVACMPSRV